MQKQSKNNTYMMFHIIKFAYTNFWACVKLLATATETNVEKNIPFHYRKKKKEKVMDDWMTNILLKVIFDIYDITEMS